MDYTVCLLGRDLPVIFRKISACKQQEPLDQYLILKYGINNKGHQKRHSHHHTANIVHFLVMERTTAACLRSIEASNWCVVRNVRRWWRRQFRRLWSAASVAKQSMPQDGQNSASVTTWSQTSFVTRYRWLYIHKYGTYLTHKCYVFTHQAALRNSLNQWRAKRHINHAVNDKKPNGVVLKPNVTCESNKHGQKFRRTWISPAAMS